MTEPASILVVDDDAEMLKALTHALQTEGYSVVARPDATSAIEFIQAGTEPFDLVITDVAMPGMRGTTFLAALKTAQPELPVILITAFGDWGQYEQAMREGACEYLTKPIDKSALLAAVRRALSADARQTSSPATPPWDNF
jgi:DNA-binding NtrC family response regulator